MYWIMELWYVNVLYMWMDIKGVCMVMYMQNIDVGMFYQFIVVEVVMFDYMYLCLDGMYWNMFEVGNLYVLLKCM